MRFKYLKTYLISCIIESIFTYECNEFIYLVFLWFLLTSYAIKLHNFILFPLFYYYFWKEDIIKYVFYFLI